jgi:chromosome partitioning protein
VAVLIGIVSQKGGVGKSTCARLIAREYANAGWTVKIADLDVSQGTSTEWKRRRDSRGIQPEIAVEPFRTVEQALRVAGHYDLLIFDAPPHSMAGTKEIARTSDLVLLPTGLSLDDLRPTVLLAHELVEAGIPSEKLAAVLCRVGDRENEILEARSYIEKAGYQVLKGELPERTAYRRAIDEGKALSETSHPSLRGRAEMVAQSIVDFLATGQKRKVKNAR